MKLVVLGGHGQLGKCINYIFRHKNNIILNPSKQEINIVDLVKTNQYLKKEKPDIIINASAYTLVDLAEKNVNDANKVNNLAVHNIAITCEKLGIIFIHISTDYVFDGLQNFPYTEDSSTNPLNVYGKTKLAGEKAIIGSKCNYIIIRTSWLFSEYGDNFLKTIIKIGQIKSELSIVSDEYGCPTYAMDLAKCLDNIVTKIEKGIFFQGVFNYCGEKICSWYDFANLIFSKSIDFNFTSPKIVKKIDSENYIRSAKRPKYSVLNNDKIRKCYNPEYSNLIHSISNVLYKLRKH